MYNLMLLQQIIDHLPLPLMGVIHTAGVTDDAIITKTDISRFKQIFYAKIKGTWNLHQLTKNLNINFFVLYPSKV